MTTHSRIETLKQNLSPFDNTVRADAAVLIGLSNEPEPTILLTQRALHMNSHAGEVAFPGGKRDADDLHLVVTALRESEEEVALPQSKVEVIGALKPARAKSGILVMPIIGVIHDAPELHGNPEEIDSVFRVPLQYFFDIKAERTHRINFRGLDLVVPCFRFDGYIIWGLTAYMLVEFMREGFGHHIDYPWPPVLPGVLVPKRSES
ncbi:CoA pyrophosphatase [Paraperlucidibaca wandonensis]|jgi:8-oxo-dGTP pyrophosphatase MutT (NUDIX family)|uniref:CoA pyrophosphatase n=1 Tax=Paraperlucidibaca wandonensis TaxID=1268273 RepID=A0ABW3HBT1_9GAMM|nr:CoA pyrophosphatase [Paraperlucidibaca sp.]MBQ0723140.1 CoA pyrophosphatase [Paraperlucidibaca sp.]MBQ0842975.1 CoA pyrophosphatase [Paraperlucidibaca sp.]|tara:strand:+ start:2351 stop:2968 length:618 start_codon:yes stop_codon:yes gene_type:complete